MSMIKDPYFRVDVLNRTEDPQTLCWFAMHQDYSEEYVFNEAPPSETEAGNLIVKHLLAGERGHYGPLEHPSITFNVGWFPHSVMQQARTHRIGISFDVQSGRYTGKRIMDVFTCKRDTQEVFYLRPVGDYTDRSGKRYQYTEQKRNEDIAECIIASANYFHKIEEGYAEEHARDMIPYAIRQHFVVSFNLRSALHFMDLRSKKDAQEEIRAMCDLMWPHLKAWAPEITAWYDKTRLHKAKLSP